MTTYTIKNKQNGHVWQFKYTLEGNFHSFEILEGQLSATQKKWLFAGENFPADESIMKHVWMFNLRKFFEINIGEPDLSFDAFWNAYGAKQKKTVAQKLWGKLPKAEKIKAMQAIRPYNNWLSRQNGIAKQLPDTFLRQKRWEDNFNS